MPRRKRLRDRVADRKAGSSSDDIGQRRPAWRGQLGLVGTVLSIGSLILLGYEGLSVVEGKPMVVDRILIYSVVFIGGRALKAGADSVRF